MTVSPTPPRPPARREADLPIDRLMREALAGAGTSVWSWDAESDHLGGMDGGVALLGYAPGERERSLASWAALIHPDDIPGMAAAYRRHRDGLVPSCEREYRARARDGSWRWMAERGRIVEWWPDGRPRRMVGTLTDVTRRKAAERSARETATQLREVARHVPGVLYLYRAGMPGREYFLFVSDRCEAVLGVEAEVLMQDASTLFDRIHLDDREAMRIATHASMVNLQPWRAEFRLSLPGQGWRWLIGNSTPRREPDGSTVWYGYLQDVTELREFERLREHAAAADAANRAKTEFLSRMSHELRTPLNAILGFTQLIEMDRQQPPHDAQQRRRLSIIRESGEHLLRMIGDLLDHARIEAGQMAVALGEVPLAPLLASAVDTLAPQAQAVSVSLAPPSVDPALLAVADPTRLRQVLFNLLGNAIKYNRRGGNVWLSAERDGAEVVLRVADSGVGIDGELQSRLFQPFDRLGHASSGIEGAGMGLAISRALVALMHGRIEVDSQAGVGSVFSVRLPAAGAAATQDAAP